MPACHVRSSTIVKDEAELPAYDGANANLQEEISECKQLWYNLLDSSGGLPVDTMTTLRG